MKKRFKRIYIEITNICNLNCSFCPPTNRKKEYMNIESFQKIISKMENYTDYIYLHIKGEPLMHPNLKEFLELCSNKFFVNITTNATLLKANKELLIDANIRQISISLHSDTLKLKKLLLLPKK